MPVSTFQQISNEKIQHMYIMVPALNEVNEIEVTLTSLKGNEPTAMQSDADCH